MSLKSRTAVITGATRGIGRGLALGLAEQGAHVVITGRTPTGPNSLEDTATAVSEAGGTCETFQVDHGDDASVADFFAQLNRSLSRNGRTLDIFVNNAYAAVPFIVRTIDESFWKKTMDDGSDDPARIWDLVNGVGLRGNYICSTYATRAMVETGGGVVINITSWGGIMHLFDPVYSVGKAGVCRLTSELAISAPKNVSFFTLCPGFVATELLMDRARKDVEKDPAGVRNTSLDMWNAESPFFVGRTLAAILADNSLVQEVNGTTVIAAEIANRLNVNDENGFRSLSGRSWRFNLMKRFPFLIKSPLRLIIPRNLYIPWWIVRPFVSAHKFWGE